MGNANIANKKNDSNASDDCESTEKQIKLPPYMRGNDFTTFSIVPHIHIDYNGCMKMVIIKNHLIFCGIIEGIQDNMIIYRIHLNEIKKLSQNKLAIQNPINYEPKDIIKMNSCTDDEIQTINALFYATPWIHTRNCNYTIALTSTYPLYIAFPTKDNHCGIFKVSFNKKHLNRNRKNMIKLKGNGNTILQIKFYLNNKNQQMVIYSTKKNENYQIFIADFMHNKIIHTMYIISGYNITFDIVKSMKNENIIICGYDQFLVISNLNNNQKFELHSVTNKLELPNENVSGNGCKKICCGSPNGRYILYGSGNGMYWLFERIENRVLLLESGQLRDGFSNNGIEGFVWLNNYNVVVTYALGCGILLDMIHIYEMRDNKQVIQILCEYNNKNMDISKLILQFCGVSVSVSPFDDKYGQNVYGSVPSEVTGLAPNDCGIFISYWSRACVLFIPHQTFVAN
eukprot:328479_1